MQALIITLFANIIYNLVIKNNANILQKAKHLNKANKLAKSSLPLLNKLKLKIFKVYFTLSIKKLVNILKIIITNSIYIYAKCAFKAQKLYKLINLY